MARKTKPTDDITIAGASINVTPEQNNTEIVKEIVAAELAPKPIKPPCVCARCVQMKAVIPGQLIR